MHQFNGATTWLERVNLVWKFVTNHHHVESDWSTPFPQKTLFDSSPLFTWAWLSQRKLKQRFFRFSNNERRYVQGWCFSCGFELNHMQVSHQGPCTLCSSCCILTRCLFSTIQHVCLHVPHPGFMAVTSKVHSCLLIYEVVSGFVCCSTVIYIMLKLSLTTRACVWNKGLKPTNPWIFVWTVKVVVVALTSEQLQCKWQPKSWTLTLVVQEEKEGPSIHPPTQTHSYSQLFHAYLKPFFVNSENNMNLENPLTYIKHQRNHPQD